MSFDLSQRIRVSSKHADIDERKGPFNSITEALNANSPTSREKGRTVYIIENGKVVEYWFEAGTADSDLVKKTQGGSGDLTPVFKTATMTDIGASESETQDDIDQKFATWIESQGFIIPQGEIWFFELLREGSEDGDGGSSNITLEQARQNGNVLEGNIIGEEEFNKQGNRKAFAQLSDVYDQFKNLPNASGISSYNKMLVTNSDGVVGERDNLQSDKSSDATFNAFKVRNSNGDEAYVSNAYNALKQSFTNMTTTQTLELAQLLNGGAGIGERSIENYNVNKSYSVGSLVFFNNSIWGAISSINAGESPEKNPDKWGGKPLVLGSLEVEKLRGLSSFKIGYSGEDTVFGSIGKETNLIMLNDYSFDKDLDITHINVRLASNEDQTNFNFYQIHRNGNSFTILDTIPLVLDKTKYGSWQTVDVSSLNKKSIKGAMLGFDSAAHVRAPVSDKNWLGFDKNTGLFVYQFNATGQTVSFNVTLNNNSILDDNKVPSLALLNSKIGSISGSGSGKVDEGWMLSGDHTISKFDASEATKIGVVLSADPNSNFENGYIESPSIIWDGNLSKYVMVYTAYSSNHVASIGWAVSDDLISWVRKGQLKVASGDIAKGDGFGLTGPCLLYYQNKYYLFAIGLNSAGYEGEPINMVLFTTDSLTAPNWEHKGIVIPIQSSIPWCNEAIFHPHPCFLNGKWYMFFNARGFVNGYRAERCGFATADSLDGTWTVDPNRISEFAESQSGQMFIMCGDPAIMEYKNNYYMFYFNLEDGAVDHWAYASKADFPRGWRYGGKASSKTLPEESTYAHKPFIIKKDNKLYHYYTGVSGQSRCIILQTFDL